MHSEIVAISTSILLAIFTSANVIHEQGPRIVRQATPFPAPATFPVLGAAPNKNLNSGYSCSLNCTLQNAAVWAQVMSMRPPQLSQVSLNTAGNKPDTVARICSVLDQLTDCLKLCPMDTFRLSIMTSLNGLQSLCDTHKSGGFAKSLLYPSQAIECLNEYANEIRSTCRNQNDRFVSQTSRLKSLNLNNSPMDLIGIVGDVCDGALGQVRCVMPAITEKCKGAGANVMEQVMLATFGTFRQLMSNNRAVSLPSSCYQLFNATPVLTNPKSSAFEPPSSSGVVVAPLMQPPKMPNMSPAADSAMPRNASGSHQLFSNSSFANMSDGFDFSNRSMLILDESISTFLSSSEIPKVPIDGESNGTPPAHLFGIGSSVLIFVTIIFYWNL